MENSKKREPVSNEAFQWAMGQVDAMRKHRVRQKGPGTFASTHEIFGIVTEEYHELSDAIRSNDIEEIKKELIDIAVGAIFGIACIDEGKIDW